MGFISTKIKKTAGFSLLGIVLSLSVMAAIGVGLAPASVSLMEQMRESRLQGRAILHLQNFTEQIRNASYDDAKSMVVADGTAIPGETDLTYGIAAGSETGDSKNNKLMTYTITVRQAKLDPASSSLGLPIASVQVPKIAFSDTPGWKRIADYEGDFVAAASGGIMPGLYSDINFQPTQVAWVNKKFYIIGEKNPADTVPATNVGGRILVFDTEKK